MQIKNKQRKRVFISMDLNLYKKMDQARKNYQKALQRRIGMYKPVTFTAYTELLGNKKAKSFKIKLEKNDRKKRRHW